MSETTPTNARALREAAARLRRILIVAAVVLALTWRAQIAVAFDREAARVSGIPVTRIDIAFNAALGAIVVAASTAVGVLLVVGYLIVPGAFGRLLASGTRAMAALAALSALVGGWAGFGVALLRAPRPLSPQACVALGVLACFALGCVIRKLRDAPAGRDEASAGPQDSLTARETARETGAVSGPDLSSARETVRETWASQLLMAGEAS